VCCICCVPCVFRCMCMRGLLCFVQCECCVHVLRVLRGATHYTVISSWIKMKVNTFCELWCIINLKFSFVTLKCFITLDKNIGNSKNRCLIQQKSNTWTTSVLRGAEGSCSDVEPGYMVWYFLPKNSFQFGRGGSSENRNWSWESIKIRSAIS
jgi:hypothetical protein